MLMLECATDRCSLTLCCFSVCLFSVCLQLSTAQTWTCVAAEQTVTGTSHHLFLQLQETASIDLLIPQTLQTCGNILIHFIYKTILQDTVYTHVGMLSSMRFLVYKFMLYPFLGQFNKLLVCRPLCCSRTCILAGGNS